MLEKDLDRYSRHIILREIGVKGVSKIRQAKVLLVGVGGLGSPAAYYLAAAGIGTLGLSDFDAVDRSNLQRQILHFTSDIGKPKIDSAIEKLSQLNPEVNFVRHEGLHQGNIDAILTQYDFVIDGTDSFIAKFLINDRCVKNNIPFSHAGVLQFSGQTMTVRPHTSACYRCVFGAPPPPETVVTCSQAGILGPVAGLLGTLQAIEAIKFITHAGELLVNQLLVVDTLTMSMRKVSVKRSESCSACGNGIEVPLPDLAAYTCHGIRMGG